MGCEDWNMDYSYGARREDCRVWRARGFCSMKNGVQIEEYGMEYGGRRMKHRCRAWLLEYGVRHGGMKNGVRNMGYGTWNNMELFAVREKKRNKRIIEYGV